MLHGYLLDPWRMAIDGNGQFRLLSLHALRYYAPHEQKLLEKDAQTEHWGNIRTLFDWIAMSPPDSQVPPPIQEGSLYSSCEDPIASATTCHPCPVRGWSAGPPCRGRKCQSSTRLRRSHSKFEPEGRKEGRMYYCGGPKQEQAAVYSTDIRDCKIATGYVDMSEKSNLT
ncbi:hypothetical protein B0H14DRAFT_3155806, partial [Mycena olivaceomarginata]